MGTLVKKSLMLGASTIGDKRTKLVGGFLRLTNFGFDRPRPDTS